jgi:hypothetical protein
MQYLANNLPPALRFSWGLLLILILITCASAAVFAWQVRRWTTHRGWRELLDWSRERGFSLSRPESPAPEPFDRIAGARVITRLESDKPRATRALQLHVAPGGGVEATRWHVMVRQLASSPWPTTGLRPATAPASVLDQFSLSSYPRMGDTARFIVFGTDSQAARILSKSQARALLPPDVGLLLHGQFMVLDFSSRPFDGIELGRMVALADQLVQHLPVS